MRNLKILAYHRILPDSRGALSVRTKDFERHFRFLIRKGWECLTLKELHEQYLIENRELDRKILVITFDDGYKDNYKYAFPILKKYDIKATVFLTVDYIGKQIPFYWDKNRFSVSLEDYPLDWNEINEMRDYGIEFGSHTLKHPKLTKIDLADARKEINESKIILDKQLHQNTISFCYPSGDLNDDICKLVNSANYQIAVVTPSRFRIKESNITLKRIGLYSSDSYFSFRLKTSFLFPALRENVLWRVVKR